MKLTILKYATLSAAVMLTGSFMPASVAAMDYAGKKVSIIVGAKPGGGADKYARMFAPYFAKHLPGKPTVLVINKPGGANLKAANWFHKNAKPDGMMAVAITTSMHTHMVFGGKKMKYNELEWPTVILSPHGSVVYAHKKTGVTGKDIVADINALKKAKVLNTSQKNPTSGEIRAAVAYDMLGIENLKWVFGLSVGKRRQSIMRGELQISMDTARSYLKSVMKYVKSGDVVPLMSFGFYEKGKFVRDPAFPDLPTVGEVYEKLHGKKPSGRKWDMLAHFVQMGVMASKAIALPPKTPANIVNVWIDTAKRITKDKKFKKVAKKLLGAYPQAFGKDAKEIIEAAVNVKPGMKKFMREWVKTEFKAGI
jgi:tripartite-type tricarboxylate transporter receptor subunit TctC